MSIRVNKVIYIYDYTWNDVCLKHANIICANPTILNNISNGIIIWVAVIVDASVLLLWKYPLRYSSLIVNNIWLHNIGSNILQLIIINKECWYISCVVTKPCIYLFNIYI